MQAHMHIPQFCDKSSSTEIQMTMWKKIHGVWFIYKGVKKWIAKSCWYEQGKVLKVRKKQQWRTLSSKCKKQQQQDKNGDKILTKLKLSWFFLSRIFLAHRKAKLCAQHLSSNFVPSKLEKSTRTYNVNIMSIRNQYIMYISFVTEPTGWIKNASRNNI